MSTRDAEVLKKARGRRLKALRLHLGQKTATTGAAFFKVKYDTYIQHERGQRDLTRDVAADYADKGGVEEVWLLWGRNAPSWAEGEIGAQRDDTPDEVANQLLAWREAAKMSVADLAEKVGASQGQVQGWEAGTLELSDKWLRKLAVALGTTPGSILDMDPESTPPGLLTLWRETADRQREVGERVRELRRAG